MFQLFAVLGLYQKIVFHLAKLSVILSESCAEDLRLIEL